MRITDKAILADYNRECGVTTNCMVALDTDRAREFYTGWLAIPLAADLAAERLRAIDTAERRARELDR